ncbi:MAG: glycosyltransferase family 4 protein [Desulfobacteraceae bacterium]|nr:glycosyltransferase family 4 protein [Desulfobacteraceae bacterium]
MSNIAFLLTSYAMGGMEMRSARMAKLFLERGYQMHYCCPNGSKLQRFLEGSGVRLFGCHIHGALDLISCFKLTRYLKKNRIQLLMAFSGSDYWMAILAARLAGVPLIISRSTATALNPLSAFVCRGASAMVSVSNSIKTQLVSQRLPAKKINVIYNGVDIDFFSEGNLSAARHDIRKALGIPSGKFVVGCLGRAEKGQDLLLAVDQQVRNQCPNLHYFFAGQRISRKLSGHLETNPSLKEHVTLKEFIDFDDVPQVLHALDVIVMLPETEPFSNAVIEAMAMQRPLILSKTSGNIEAVEDNRSGILVDRTDKEAIVKALTQLYQCPEKCHQIGEAAGKRARTLFSQQSMLEQYAALWRRLGSHS